MNTLLLAAGGSVAFEEAGYFYPKNLVEVDGAPLLSHVIGALGDLARNERLITVVRREEAVRHHVNRVVSLVEPSARVVQVGQTSGAACTALLAAELIDEDAPLLVVNGDQIIDADLSAVVAEFDSAGLDAGVVVFDAVHPRWSYVRVHDGLVVQASEKRPISRLATAGFYWFRRGGDFVDGAMAMIRKDGHVEDQFFVCPVLNELVLAGRRIGIHPLARAAYFSLHEPAGIRAYEHFLDRRAAAA